MMVDVEKLRLTSSWIRRQILEMTTAVGSGHPSSSLSAVELMVGLMFGGVFKYSIEKIENGANDRLIFSKGHASPLFYALWAAAGGIKPAELSEYRKFGSRLEGHPTRKFPFTEVPTGSLGQGLSVGLGMALVAKAQGLGAHTYVLLGDSEMAEGNVWEAVEVAGFKKISNLTGIVDANRLGQRGETMAGMELERLASQIEGFGWQTEVIDGHNLEEIGEVLAKTREGSRPVMIVAKTIKGKGVSEWEDQEGWHAKQLSSEKLAGVVAHLEHELPKLEITRPGQVQVVDGEAVVSEFQLAIEEKISTKQAAGLALERLGKLDAKVWALDAEVSNSTHLDLFFKAYGDRSMQCYLTEQNMVAMAVGMARRGVYPVVASFGAFLTRAFDQLRMAGYAQVPMMVWGAYAGVSVGLDGSSQMAVEDVAMMRSVFGSVVLYPADGVATVGLVKVARGHNGLAYLRLTREATEVIYQNKEEFVIGGSKVIGESEHDEVTVVAAGITVHEAIKAQRILAEDGVRVRVVDCYSVKPIDGETLVRAARETKALVVVEDHGEVGGLAEAVRSSVVFESKPVVSLCVREIPMSGLPSELLAYEKIDSEAIVAEVKKLL